MEDKYWLVTIVDQRVLAGETVTDFRSFTLWNNEYPTAAPSETPAKWIARNGKDRKHLVNAMEITKEEYDELMEEGYQ